MVLPFALLILFWLLIFLCLIGLAGKLFGPVALGIGRALREGIRSFREGMRKG